METHLKGIAVESLLGDPKKETAFHMIYHEADSDGAENPSASTDLYHRIVRHGSQAKVCALLYILKTIMCSLLKKLSFGDLLFCMDLNVLGYISSGIR